MDAGPFVSKELLACALSAAEADVGSFFLTEGGPAWAIGLPTPIGQTRARPAMVALTGESPFHLPAPPLPRKGLQIKERSVEVVVGEMVGNTHPLAGDLGVASDGELAALVRITDSHGNHDVPITLTTGNLPGNDLSHYVWVRKWRLDLVSEDGRRRLTLLDRL
jgi:hypothetical protein